MKSTVLRIFLICIFISSLLGIILYARGYRLNIEKRSIVPTGILVASSFPNGAKVYVNGILKGATDTNISLAPGKYDIEIRKEGYTPWKRTMNIKGEIVIKTDSLLFPQNPSLSPLTSLGIASSTYSQNTDNAILVSQNENAEKDGVYLLDTAHRTLSLFNPLKLLISKLNLGNIDIATTSARFSPDGKQVLLNIVTSPVASSSYLLAADQESKQALNVTKSRDVIEQAWKKEENQNIEKILETFKDPLPKIASDSFKIVRVSPDDSKLLYKATQNITIPTIIHPPLIGADQHEESRTIITNNWYVYDQKEDKNYLINLPEEKTMITKKNVKPPVTNWEDKIIWYPDSRHLILNEDNKISVMDYDGGNKETVYSGPYEKNFFGVTVDGNLLILANLNPNNNKFPDVYTVGIR